MHTYAQRIHIIAIKIQFSLIPFKNSFLPGILLLLMSEFTQQRQKQLESPRGYFKELRMEMTSNNNKNDNKCY